MAKKDEDADPNVHMFTHSAVHLDSRSFRGSDAERSQYQKEFTDTNIYIHKADVLSVSDCFAGWRDSEFPIRSLFNFTVDESRSNVFSFKTCQKPVRCEVAGSANTTNVNSCQKPMRLIMRLIQHFSREGDTVLDLCAGTGTTAVACLLLNRHSVAMENDEFQFELMPKRLPEAITTIDDNSNVETKRVSLHRVTTSAEGVEKVTEIEL